MGKVHLLAAASVDNGRLRYRKPFVFAALKSQSKAEISERMSQIRAGAGGDDTALEKGLMMLLRGVPHVIQLYEVWHDTENVHTVMEYLQDDVIGLLNRIGVLEEETAQRVFVHTCLGLKALHDARFCHRDLSPENVMVTTDVRSQPLAKVIDFGMAARLPDDDKCLPGLRIPFGKMSYLSPEYFGKMPYDGRKNDIWALGCTLFTLTERKMLFEQPSLADPRFALLHANRHQELFNLSRSTNHNWHILPESDRRPPMSQALADLLAGLLQVNPDYRVASVDDILAHPWVSEHVAIARAEWEADNPDRAAAAAAAAAAGPPGGPAAGAAAAAAGGAGGRSPGDAPPS
ncbi:hypothetical protein FNF27_04949 [Cafeteria roenbergensis]|uniref:Protein kinase domain-containing protein n=1 Tax=Cafeteria roenbergensis TaxID=33653 RepID=A0A5A8E746_CAFRO|nr:hypothetical protein FNF27_04949 [Cafeteria roenbergensis]